MKMRFSGSASLSPRPSGLRVRRCPTLPHRCSGWFVRRLSLRLRRRCVPPLPRRRQQVALHRFTSVVGHGGAGHAWVPATLAAVRVRSLLDVGHHVLRRRPSALRGRTPWIKEHWRRRGSGVVFPLTTVVIRSSAVLLRGVPALMRPVRVVACCWRKRPLPLAHGVVCRRHRRGLLLLLFVAVASVRIRLRLSVCISGGRDLGALVRRPPYPC